MTRINTIALSFFFLLSVVHTTNASYLVADTSWGSQITDALWTSMVSGDVNNDGFQDLVQIGCTNNAGGYCRTVDSFISKVYLNNGISFAQNSSWYSTLKPVQYGSIGLGDINNDGSLDLVLSGCIDHGGSTSACLDDFSSVYVNNGSSFVENSAWKGDILNAWKSSFAFGDVNNDGKLDFVMSGDSLVYGPLSKIYINNGTSFRENNFWEQSLTGVFGSSTTLVDVDNDGDLDLFLVGDSGSGYVAKAYINNGSSFVENSSWEQNLLGVELASTVWGDFDNNGRMDFSLIGHTSSDNHEIYNNTGNSLTLTNKNSPYGNLIGIYEGTQTLGDYDNDGKIDLFTSGEEQYSTLYVNIGGNFTGYLNDPEINVFNTAFGPSAIWSDVDNDGDLDLILSGYDEDTQDLNASVYISNITVKNTTPSPPSTLNANYSNGVLNLSWSAGSDVETPTLGLYYNLRAGTSSGGNQIVTGVYGGGDDNGYFGNMIQRRNILLNLPNLSGTIYWSVQTIDTGLNAGSWSTEQVLNISSGSQGQSQSNETTSPNVTIISPLNGSTLTSSSVSVTANYSDVSNTTCETKLDSGSYSSMALTGAKNGTASYTFTSVSNGAHTVYVNCTDIYSNSVLKSFVFTVNVPAPPASIGSGSSGGGGGGSIGGTSNRTISNNNTQPIPIIHETEKTINITEGVTKTIELNTVVTSASVEVTNTANSVHIVAVLVKAPSVPKPSGNVYSYIEI